MMIGSGDPLMPRLSSPPQLPPLKPLERLLMGLTLLLLLTPAIVAGHFLIGGWGGSSLIAEGAAPTSNGEVVLAERLSPSPPDQEGGRRTDR
jgi:hypothetical protein